MIREARLQNNECSVTSGVNGVVPIIPIPFSEEEELDEQALRTLIDFAIRCSVCAICLPAYGSEFYKLSDEERARVVRIAVDQAAGRLLVIAQCNHGSSRVAQSIVRRNAEAGADVISLALPRLFPLSDHDLLRYLIPILQGTELPILLQDFNPGGSTMTADLVADLKRECPNFKYLKLEEPLLGRKVLEIREKTGDSIGILEGWGGMYMMELVPLGICGVMPGLSMADLLNQVFELRKGGESEAAFTLFGVVLPQITFALQNFELYLYCEKRLLEARGLLNNSRSRLACFRPSRDVIRYVEELNERILDAIERLHPTIVGV